MIEPYEQQQTYFVFWDKTNYFNLCYLLSYSEVCVTPHSPPAAEERPAASEESSASDTEDRPAPAAEQAEGTPGKKRKRKRKRKRNKKTKAEKVEW